MQHSYEIVDRIRKTRTIDRQTLEELLTTEDAGLKRISCSKGKRDGTADLWKSDLYERSDRVYQLPQKRLLLLWNPLQQ